MVSLMTLSTLHTFPQCMALCPWHQAPTSLWIILSSSQTTPASRQPHLPHQHRRFPYTRTPTASRTTATDTPTYMATLLQTLDTRQMSSRGQARPRACLRAIPLIVEIHRSLANLPLTPLTLIMTMLSGRRVISLGLRTLSRRPPQNLWDGDLFRILYY